MTDPKMSDPDKKLSETPLLDALAETVDTLGVLYVWARGAEKLNMEFDPREDIPRMDGLTAVELARDLTRITRGLSEQILANSLAGRGEGWSDTDWPADTKVPAKPKPKSDHEHVDGGWDGYFISCRKCPARRRPSEGWEVL